jgi:hypothetical protein
VVAAWSSKANLGKKMASPSLGSAKQSEKTRRFFETLPVAITILRSSKGMEGDQNRSTLNHIVIKHFHNWNI